MLCYQLISQSLGVLRSATMLADITNVGYLKIVYEIVPQVAQNTLK